MPNPSLPAQIRAVTRALDRTRRVSTLLVAHGRMPAPQHAQDLADLEAALATLQGLVVAQVPLFAQEPQ